MFPSEGSNVSLDSGFYTTDKPENNDIHSLPHLDNHSVFTNQSISDTSGLEQTLGITSLWGIITISTISGILTMFTIIGNILVIVAFRINKQLQSLSNYCLVSLAVSDLTVGIFLTPMYSLYLLIGYWPLGSSACYVWLCLDYSLCTASELNMLVIALDRHLSVTHPFTYLSKRTPRKMGAMIASAWIVAIVIWSPLIIAWPYIEGKFIVPVDDCYIQYLETNPTVTTLMCLVAVYIPLFVTVILYIDLYRRMNERKLRRKAQRASVALAAASAAGHDDLPNLNQSRSPIGCLAIFSCKRCCRKTAYRDKNEQREIHVNETKVSTDHVEEHVNTVSPEDKQCKNIGENPKTDTERCNDESGDGEKCNGQDAVEDYQLDNDLNIEMSSGKEMNFDLDNYTCKKLENDNTCFSITKNPEKDGHTCFYDKIHKPMNTDAQIVTQEVVASKLNSSRKKTTHTKTMLHLPTEMSSDVIDALPSTFHGAVKEQIMERRQRRHQDNKTAKILCALLLVFAISFTPYYTCTIIEAYCKGCVNKVFHSIGKFYITVNQRKTVTQKLAKQRSK